MNATNTKSLVRSDLLLKLCADNPELTPNEVERIVSFFFKSIIKQLENGGRVELRGFGAFSTRCRDARKCRNPRTGEPVDVSPKAVPYFRPSKEMAKRLTNVRICGVGSAELADASPAGGE